MKAINLIRISPDDIDVSLKLLGAVSGFSGSDDWIDIDPARLNPNQRRFMVELIESGKYQITIPWITREVIPLGHYIKEGLYYGSFWYEPWSSNLLVLGYPGTTWVNSFINREFGGRGWSFLADINNGTGRNLVNIVVPFLKGFPFSRADVLLDYDSPETVHTKKVAIIDRSNVDWDLPYKNKKILSYGDPGLIRDLHHQNSNGGYELIFSYLTLDRAIANPDVSKLEILKDKEGAIEKKWVFGDRFLKSMSEYGKKPELGLLKRGLGPSFNNSSGYEFFNKKYPYPSETSHLALRLIGEICKYRLKLYYGIDTRYSVDMDPKSSKKYQLTIHPL